MRRGTSGTDSPVFPDGVSLQSAHTGAPPVKWITRERRPAARCLSIVAALALAPACHHSAPPSTAAPPPESPSQSPPTVHPDEESPRTTRTTALSIASRDSLLQEVQARRAAWRARAISDYDVRVTVACFCPGGQTPAVLEVRGGRPVALRDTLGAPAGAVREPWSRYTVDGLFDAAEAAARQDDVVDVRYDARFGYPAEIRGDRKVGLPDDWYWIRASHLTPARETR
jgi:hypothetical protein